MANPLWYKSAVFYEVHPRAYRDSNGDGHGDLRGVIQKLDYLRDLGVDCLWLLPIYGSPLVDDGYDIADYYSVHPDYGTLGDFKELVEEAHRRGMRVIADLVLNHTSDQHPWFQAARSDPNSPFRAYYVWSDTSELYREARIIFLDTEASNWTYDEKAGQYFWHRFYSQQPDLNFDNPAVREEMKRVMQFWLDLGIDGFRADAVPYLFERAGTNGENLPETHAYLKEIRRFMDEHYPGRILLCEANQWPQDVRPYFGDGDEFHMGFHFPVMPRLYMALALADRTPIVEILAATPPIPENCQWCTFLRNHDELTLEMVTPAERDFMWATYAPEPRMRLNLGIRRRLAPLLDGDRRKIELLNAILFSLPGSPILYYGDEIGMGDNIWLHDRNGVRTPMQWDGRLNAGFSEADPDRLYAPVIADSRFGYTHINVEAQRADPGSLWHTLRDLIALRREHPAFGFGRAVFLSPNSPAILAFVVSDEKEQILAVHNLSGEPQTADLDLARWQGARLVDLSSKQARNQAREQALPTIGAAPYILALQPYEYAWYQVG
jgi:maltose alpha-D-glucosyltransferase/alpha-amylase